MSRCHGQTQITKEGEPMPRLILPRPIEIPIGPSIAYVPLTQGQFALIDRDNAAMVGLHNWYARWSAKTASFYGYRNKRRNGKYGLLALHVLLCPEAGDIKDHANRNTLDDRKCNLRGCSYSQNAQNRTVSILNSTGLKGIYRVGNKFRVSVAENGRRVHGGYFDTPEEAKKVRDQLAVSMHGKFARSI